MLVDNKCEPLVSIIIATYRRDKSLENALKSLVSQTYNNIEIIVVDDNSDSIWNEKVRKIITEIDHPIKYIQNEENKGSAETRNIGINVSQGEYITFLDDDDIYLKNKIKNQVEHMIIEKSDFCITDLELLSESNKRIEIRRREYIEETDNNSLLKYHLMHHMTGTDTMMFKREYLLKIGCFPKIDIGDEFYLMLRAIEEGGKFSYLPESNVKAYVHINTDGLSSGDSKINGANELHKFKTKFFHKLDKKSIRYIKMRHHAVIAFAEIRRKNYISFLVNSIKSVFCSPLECFKLLLDRY